MAVRMVGSEAGCSVVPPAGVDTQVSATIANKPAEFAFKTLAAQVGLIAEYKDGVVRFVKADDVTPEVLLVHPGYEDAKAVSEVLGSVLKGTKVSLVGNRVAIAFPPDQREAVRAVLDSMQTGPDAWLLDVKVFAITGGLTRELGIGLAGSGSGDFAFGGRAGSFGGAPLTGARAVAALRLVASAVAEGRDARMVTQGTLAIVEGSEAELQQGEVVPVPQRTVSPEGVVTVTGFTQVKTGFNLKASGRRIPGGLRLELAPTLSSVSGFVEGYPIVSERSVSGSMLLSSGDWSVLSGLQLSQTSQTDGGGGVIGSVVRNEASRESVLVAVRATRVRSTTPVVVAPLGGGGSRGTGAATEPPSQNSGFPSNYFGGLPDAVSQGKTTTYGETLGPVILIMLTRH